MPTNKTVAELLCAGVGIIDLLPPEMAEVTRRDAEYHGQVRNEWIELNQIETERNRKFHDDALREVAAELPPEATILELGSGVGYDAGRFLQLGVPFGCYIVSEISPLLLEHAKNALVSLPAGKLVRYCCLDAAEMRIANSQVDRVLTIAAVHHFPKLDQALAEIDRVTRAGAKIVFAIEPNRLWSTVMVGLRPFYRRLFSNKAHSAADEEAEGFRLRDFANIGTRLNWQLQRVVPVWFFTGFLHIGLETLYRLLRLNRRIKVPTFIEKAFLVADALFFRIPFANKLAWHYSVVFRK